MLFAELPRDDSQVAEGVVSSQSVQQIARDHGVDMPITDAVVGVCH